MTACGQSSRFGLRCRAARPSRMMTRTTMTHRLLFASIVGSFLTFEVHGWTTTTATTRSGRISSWWSSSLSQQSLKPLQPGLETATTFSPAAARTTTLRLASSSSDEDSETVPSNSPSITTATTTTPAAAKTTIDTTSSNKNDDFINDFCRGTNEFWKRLVIQPVREYVELQPAGTAASDPLAILTAAPEVPGIPRPVWLVILGSVPTALGWYGYYKFSIEEELYQYELQHGDGKVSGCGGYGTLFPFVYGVIIGFPLSLIGPLHDLGEAVLQAAAFWILAGQVNLYRRVNELYTEDNDEQQDGDSNNSVMQQLNMTQPPLYEWWALLPPPLDVVVGLRQVHFLSEYWRIVRKRQEVPSGTSTTATSSDRDDTNDVIAETLFPFISSDRFTLRQFFLEPRRWFWFTTEWEDFEQLKQYWKE